MFGRKPERKVRPSYPSQGRQFAGLFLTVFVIVGMDVAVQNGLLRDPGGIYLLLAMVVSFLSGLRTSLICIGLILAYLSMASYIPGSAFEHTPSKDLHIFGLGIVLPFFALTIGLIQGRLRTAAMREYDAIAKAESETAQRERTEDLWRLVVDSTMDAIVATDEDGRITLWSRNAEALFGWTSEEIIGQEISKTIIPHANRQAYLDRQQRFLETKDPGTFGSRLEASGLAKDERIFPAEVTVVPHETDSGYIFVAFIRDMTESKKLNERLRQAQKMEAVGTLAGGIAHDFNNILAAISGNLALAREEIPADHPVQESHSEIEKAAKRATYVVRQILTFSSAQETRAEAIDPAETLQEAINLLRATVPASMEIQSHFEPDLPPIVADVTDLHQVVINLGINASHAMKGQSGKFEIQVNCMDIDEATAESLLGIAPGPYVRISVGDTGHGMDAQTLQRVFEPFFTTKSKGEGTGLGLAVVYGIVERYRGAITVYSEPGKGTVFHLYFPVADAPAADTATATIAALPGNGERILYVDDDEALVFMMKRMLLRLNYQVAGFQDPREALEVFKANPYGFDLAITDMSMPHIDGPALVHELHAIRPDFPIVMVTGYIRPSDLEQARDLGIKELILKPNTVHEMGETLHRILEELGEESASVGA
jgi:PAS domain S-box-containing protein